MEGERHWYLNDINLFDVMCPHKVKDFVEKNHFRTYSKGEVIYFTEDPAHSIYLIASGKVRIVNYTEEGDEIVKQVLGRGEVFGELAMLGEEVRSEVAEALTDDTTLCPVDIREVDDLMKDNREFSLKIFKLIGLRISKLERKVESLVFKDVRQRLAEFLIDFAEQNQQDADDQGNIPHVLTHRDIGQLVGTSRQTVATLINEWKDAGALDFQRRSFRILKPENLV